MILRGDEWAARLRDELGGPHPDMNAWMQRSTRVLKSDAASEVGLLTLGDKLCCIKYYRHKSLRHRLLLRTGRGRPVRSFDVGNQLVDAGVVVPTPLAVLRVPGGALLLMEGVPEAEALDLLWKENLQEEEVKKILGAAGERVAQLHRAGFAHGDCKWRNLLWSPRGCHLVDLDAAGQAPMGSPRQARDVARFTLDAEELGLSRQLFGCFLDSYLSGTGRDREEVTADALPSLRKLRKRHLARYGRSGQVLLGER